MVIEAHVCEQLAQGCQCFVAAAWPRVKPATVESQVGRCEGLLLPDSQNLNFYLPAPQANAHTTGRREEMTKMGPGQIALNTSSHPK